MYFKPEEIFTKVLEFNEFVWTTDGRVERNKYRSEYKKSDEAKSDENPLGDPRVVSIIRGQTVIGKKSFVDFMSLNLPTQIHSYIRLYPSWVYSSSDSWNGAVKANDSKNPYYPLIAHVNGLETVLRGK